MNDVKYPNVEVELVGEDGNAMSIIARVRKALRREVDADAADAFTDAAKNCGSYDELLQLVMETVEVT